MSNQKCHIPGAKERPHHYQQGFDVSLTTNPVMEILLLQVLVTRYLALPEKGLLAQRPSESIIGKDIEAGVFESKSSMQSDKANDGCCRPTADYPFQTEPSPVIGSLSCTGPRLCWEVISTPLYLRNQLSGASVMHSDVMLNTVKDVAAVLQALEVSQATLDRWRKQFGGMKAMRLKTRILG